jgi:hypothetical protein
MRFGAVELDAGLTRWRRCRTSSRFAPEPFHTAQRRTADVAERLLTEAPLRAVGVGADNRSLRL